jgi:hypothetical protein
VDDIHQTIIPGQDGLYLRIREKLLLAALRDKLQHRKDDVLNAVRGARHQLVATAEEIANQTALSNEKGACNVVEDHADRLAGVLLGLFDVVCQDYPGRPSGQIKAIESTNESLTAEFTNAKRWKLPCG